MNLEDRIKNIKENHRPIPDERTFSWNIYPISDKKRWTRKHTGIVVMYAWIIAITCFFGFANANFEFEAMLDDSLLISMGFVFLFQVILVSILDYGYNYDYYRGNPKDIDFCKKYLTEIIESKKNELDEFMKPYGLNYSEVEKMAKHCVFKFCITPSRIPEEIVEKINKALKEGSNPHNLGHAVKIAAFTRTSLIGQNYKPIIFMDVGWMCRSAKDGKITTLFRNIMIHEFCHVITPIAEKDHHGPLFKELMNIFGEEHAESKLNDDFIKM
jgi:hypothetical protein